MPVATVVFTITPVLACLMTAEISVIFFISDYVLVCAFVAYMCNTVREVWYKKSTLAD